MPLFQRPAETPEEIAASAPLSIPPSEVGKMSEEEWYQNAYRGEHAPQLTWRAVILGSLLGFLLAFTNLYIGLKVGIHVGVAITACVMSFVLWNLALKMGLARSQLGILENNCMQSTASAAGYSTGSTMVSALPALLMLTVTPENPAGEHMPWPLMASWTAAIALLGVSLAIPIKRSLINRERLTFPSGTAAAVTLQTFYASGEEAVRKARVLLWTALAGAVFPLLIDMNAVSKVVTNPDGSSTTTREPLLPATWPMFDWLPGRGSHTGADGQTAALKPSDWGVVWDMNPVMVAAGALVGLRTGVWMLLAALALAWLVGPAGLEYAWTNPKGDVVYGVTKAAKAWKEVGLWLGAPIMVASGLLSFAFQWRTIVRAFQGLRGGEKSQHADVEVSSSWFAAGVLVSGAAVVGLAHAYFEIPFYYGILAVLMTFALCLVAARATGEADFTPTGAMGKIMQLTYGALIPQNATANLMTAGITAGAASASADLLNDLKSGYLLGADPRRQFVAQAAGILSGTIATVIGFYLFIPDATALMGTDDKAPAFPAPAAQSWRAVAEVFKLGFDNLHEMHVRAIFVGLIIGAGLVLLEKAAGKYRTWVPSATGIGLGFVLPAQYPISLFVGAVIAALWSRTWKKSAEEYLVPASSGLIAGISILGVIVQVINNFVLK